MISFIKGELSEILGSSIIVDTGGVGYEINVPLTVLSELPRIGEEVKIYTYFKVSEDAMSLYGFSSQKDKEMFEQLIGVSGIGPKGALAILSTLSPDDLRMAIMAGDDKAIAKAPGIGAKTAQRVIIDLKDKIGIEDIMGVGKTSKANAAGASAVMTGVIADAVSALSVLGYSQTEAMKAVRSIEINDDTTVEEVIKIALQRMV